ncbi:methyltransferase [Shewanella psychropiezotolerans]|uniref:Methyltransferase n=1 Tax=Shewanella psychropiezotolerans TaxID=2593655 RepID=A0ABX5X107_9GAMM|nr:methyltransferase [Shewanella psychropiezotolerans]QDO85004.1 methyltransferase [Shewanella psychropiezotolerans]
MSANTLQATSHRHRLKQLDTLLVQSRALWQVKAFDCTQLPWEKQFPGLAEKVWSISDVDIDELDKGQAKLNAELLPALLRDLKRNGSAWQLDLLLQVDPVLTGGNTSQLQHSVQQLSDREVSHLSAGIKGRKWSQITAFAAQIKQDSSEVLEWCAGKGHLGRLIAKAHSRPVVSLEWQQSLCDEGAKFAGKWDLPQEFICADAFTPQQSKLKRDQQAVALHACGDLHVRLLRLASQANTRSIIISPCCYHLIQAEQYQGMSEVVLDSELMLSPHDLQVPLQHSTIANAKQVEYRHREIVWRLGFDSLQRDVNRSRRYLPIPSIKQSQLNQGFEAFCHWAAGKKSVELPVALDVDFYLELGVQRQRLTRRIDLVAHLFRDILEHWLLLDRVCFLEEQGYSVKLTRFCSEAITPRNSLILAEKPANECLTDKG